jgi:hypothetical protein
MKIYISKIQPIGGKNIQRAVEFAGDLGSGLRWEKPTVSS